MHQTTTWQPIGAWTGGTVTALALSPRFSVDGTILAATQAGIFRSTHGGWQWRRSNNGLADPVALALAFAPSVSDEGPIAFVTTGGGRLYRSHNGGESWREVEAWAGLGVATALAVSPNYAADRSLFAATADGVFRSQDDGRTWESSTFGLLDTEVLCIACAPDFAESQTLWIGTALGGFYRSRNAARAWRESGVGLPDAAVQCLLVSPGYAQDRTLLVGTEQHGVYTSTDGGAIWHAASPDLNGQSVNSLVSVGKMGNVLLAGTESGLYRSTDGGARWQSVDDDAFAALTFAAADETVVAGAFVDGVWRSDDGGANWQPANTGIMAHAPPLVQQTADGALFALDLDGELAYTTDGGQSWQRVEMGPVEAFALAPGPRSIRAVADGALHSAHVDEMQNGPADWTQRPIPVERASLLAVSPQASVTGGAGHAVLLGDHAGALHLSQDDGQTWQTLEPPQAHATLLHAFFAPASAPESEIYAVTARQNEQENFAIGVWQTDAANPAWENVALFETEIPSVLAAAPADPTERALFFATQNRMIKLFADTTGALQVSQHFFPADVRVSALAASTHYAQDRTLFVGGRGCVFGSQDGGTSWEQLDGGLPPLPVVTLLPQAEDNDLIAVTLGGGVWHCAVNDA